jgi:hypothetical protein
MLAYELLHWTLSGPQKFPVSPNSRESEMGDCPPAPQANTPCFTEIQSSDCECGIEVFHLVHRTSSILSAGIGPVGMWYSFVIIHVVMIRKRWQPARQQLLRGVTSLATLCIYRP